MLCAEKIGKRFGARVVLRGLSFEVLPRNAVAIVGANGAGKSTLLKIVCGLMAASVGKIAWRENGEISGRELGQMCGLAAPDAPLPRELTALENLEFLARLRGLNCERETLLAHLDKWHLRARANDFAGDLSSGLRARLGLAAATLHSPKILLLDEPGANLDSDGRALLQNALLAQRQIGITLVATNDAREADLCDARIEVGANRN